MTKTAFPRSGSKKTGGFTLIELAIVLAITALLASGLWRMMSSGNTQLRDQAASDQQKTLITAVRGYLASAEGFAAVTGSATVQFDLPLPPAATGCAAPYAYTHFCDFLPGDFNADTVNSYNQNYEIRVLREEDGGGTMTGYAFMIKTTGGEVIADTSGGRISSFIGNDGGFVYEANVCGGAGVMACGAYGTWAIDPTSGTGFDYAASAAGQIASRTFVGLNASLNTPWLARQDIPGDTAHDYNTMSTDISLGGNILTSNGAVLTGDPGPRIDLESPASAGNGSLLLKVVSCNDDALVSACLDAIAIDGRVTIDGLLKADKLFAGSFIYNTMTGPSDIRLKRDIVRVDHALEKISSINGYSFFFKDSDRKRYGVIAQEVEAIFPELVTDMGDGYKGVDYVGLIGPLIEAVKDLRTRNEELASKIEALEQQNKKHQHVKKSK